MNPVAWRKREKLTLRALASKFGVAWSSLHRYETGESESPNSITLKFRKISKGEVTAEDLNRVRQKYLAKQEREDEGITRKAAGL